MAIFFPVGNKALASSLTYEISTAVFRWLFPHASAAAVDIFYIVFRKSLHFIEYGILAYLLYRAFRGPDRRRWSARWALRAGAVAVAYGFLDEYLQSFVPNRNGSSFDWGVDIAGIAAVLGAKFLRRNSAGPGPLTGALFLKRPFDIALSFIGLVLSSPLWLLFGLLIWLQDRGPVFYGQERVGKNGRIFKALKFRSMIVDAEKGRGAVQAVENDPRVTKIGRILRATAMDELPQLWNIFKGDMSFVGPRALRPNEKEVHGRPGHAGHRGYPRLSSTARRQAGPDGPDPGLPSRGHAAAEEVPLRPSLYPEAELLAGPQAHRPLVLDHLPGEMGIEDEEGLSIGKGRTD